MKKSILSSLATLLLTSMLAVPFMVTSQTTNKKSLVEAPPENNLGSMISTLKAKHQEAFRNSPMSPIWTVRHPFDRRVFIENNGQFNGYLLDPNFNIEYGVREDKTFAYFSKTGIVYRHEVYPTITEEEKEKLEELVGSGKKRFEKLLIKKSSTVTFLGMEWVGANENVVIESENKVPDYFMYSTIKAYAYEKITYKNLYPNIDVEYTMRPFEEGGMKYVIILNPGADPSQIKMKYADDVKVKLNEAGDLILKSGKITIKDLAPETFYSNGRGISSSFELQDNEVTFIIGDYNNSKTVIIDPTVLFPAAAARPAVAASAANGWTATPAYDGGVASGKAYDVDFDFAGNVYVYGGAAPFSILKFDTGGNLLWSFDIGDFYGAPGTSGAFGTAYGDFVVDPISQSLYVCEGFALFDGCRVGKISPIGDSVSIYAGASDFNEMWRMGYNACTGQAVIAGASSLFASTNLHMALVDTAMTQNDAVDVLGNANDMATLAMDNFGSCFSACSQIGENGDPNTTNEMVKMSVPGFAVDWKKNSQHGNEEFNSTGYVDGNSGGYNGLAVSDNFLYSYDGHILRKWNKGTGVVVNSLIIVPGNADFTYGGIDVDADDNVYIGFNNSVDIYDVNLTLISSTAQAGTVCDVKLSADEQVYVCGFDFVTTFPAIPMTNNFKATITSNCGGDTEAFPVNGVEPYFYSWAPGGEITKAITVAPGDYTVTVTESSCDKLVTTQTVTVSGGSAVTVGISPPVSICENEPTTLTASGTSTYTWLPVAGLSATTGASVVATPTVTTTYTVTGGSAGCTGTAEVTVTVTSSPVVSVNNVAMCTGLTATLIASGATTYDWLPNVSLDVNTGATVNSTTTSSITYTVTGTTNGCTDTAQALVTISGLPPVDAGADITICSGEIGTIGAAAVAPHTYGWSPYTDLNDSSLASPTVTTINNTGSNMANTYTITTNPGGCEATDEVIVTILPEEDTTFTYLLATFCPPGTESPTVGVAGGAFTVSPATGLSINAGGDVDLTASTAGTYNITYTTSTACPNATDFSLTITTAPDATFSYAGPYCQDVVNPIPTFPVGSSAGVFSSAPGLVFVNTATGEIDLAGSTAGTYTVTNDILAGGGCPAATATNTVTVNAIPATTVDNPTVCGGQPAILTAGGADTYVWSDGSSLGTLTVAPTVLTSYTVTGTTNGCSFDAVGTVTTNTIPIVLVNSDSICMGDTLGLVATGADTYLWSDGATGDTKQVIPTANTSYTVTGTALGCPAEAIATVAVSPLPTITINQPTICSGLPATLTASGGGSYIWLADTSFVNPKVFSPTATMNDTVFASTANCVLAGNLGVFFNCFMTGCTNFATTTVTVTQQPVLAVTAPAGLCAGESATMTVSGGSTYTWEPGTLSGSMITVTPTSTTTYTVSDNTPGCSDTEEVTINVDTPPTMLVNSTGICDGETATLSASGATTYSWSTGSTQSSIDVTPTTLTSYTVTGNPGGCDGTAVATVSVNALPTITATSDSACGGINTLLTASGGISYSWSSGGTLAGETVSPAATTTYTVTGYDATGCGNTATGTVTIFPTPTANFEANPNPAGVLTPIITFKDKSTSDVNTWSWDFADGDSSSTQNPVHTYPNVETTYIVILEVANAGSCTDTVIKSVVIGPEFTFYMPNAFTPADENGLNDYFGASGEGIVEFKLMIFDRWGNLVFTGEDIDEKWDGKFNGSELIQEDVYIWKVNLTNIHNKELEFIGTVTVVK